MVKASEDRPRFHRVGNVRLSDKLLPAHAPALSVSVIASVARNRIWFCRVVLLPDPNDSSIFTELLADGTAWGVSKPSVIVSYSTLGFLSVFRAQELCESRGSRP